MFLVYRTSNKIALTITMKLVKRCLVSNLLTLHLPHVPVPEWQTSTLWLHPSWKSRKPPYLGSSVLHADRYNIYPCDKLLISPSPMQSLLVSMLEQILIYSSFDKLIKFINWVIWIGITLRWFNLVQFHMPRLLIGSVAATSACSGGGWIDWQPSW